MANPLRTDILHDPILQHARADMTRLETGQSVGEALAALRRAAPSDKILYLYVVNPEGRLAGVVPVRRLLTSPPEEKIGAIMIDSVIALPCSASVLEACDLFLRHRLLALPVVDEAGQPVGVVDISLFTDEVGAAARQHEVNSAFQLIGVHVALGRKVPAWVSFKDRFPWLLCNMASGIACAFIAGRYELLIAEVTILALFLTVVLALGESVSMQSMTMTLQGLAQQRPSPRQVLAALKQELATAAMLGAGCGLVVGLIAWAWKGKVLAASVIGGSIALAILTACLLGVLIPTAIRALRADPKIAAGPIVLAAADIATLLFYFNLSQWLLA